MKWADLGKQILKMTPQELNQEVIITLKDEAYKATNLLINKNLFDCDGFQDGDPYLEVEGEELKDVFKYDDDFETGQLVHIDTDSEEWGVRVCGDGTIVEVNETDCLVDVPEFEGGTKLIVLKSDMWLKES
jgi:hypothetical protein